MVTRKINDFDHELIVVEKFEACIEPLASTKQ